MAHKVKCYVCGEYFDRDKIEFVQNGRRYRHASCEEKETIMSYLIKLFGKENINYPLVGTHIKRYKEQGYTENGILASLKYWYEIKGHTVSENEYKNKTGGLGIIPYIYPLAKEYYYKIELAKEANKHKDFTVINKTIKIDIPKAKENRKNFFDSIEEGEID